MSQEEDAGKDPGSYEARGLGLSAESLPGSSGFTSGPSASFPLSRMLSNRAGITPSTPPLGRLSSLRTRDLTLGGAFKKTKKTIEPNVHAVRKSKEEFKEEVHAAPKKERRQRDERRRESRGRRKEPQTIQSHSIFEQGPASIDRKSGWNVDADKRYSSKSALSKAVNKEREESEEREDDILSKLQRDDFIDDPGLRNDAELKPILLPLSKSTSIEAPTCTLSPESLRSLSCEGPGRTDSLVHLLQDLKVSGREELFFMQLPDCLPVDRRPASQAPEEKHVKKDVKSTHKRPEQTQTQLASVKERSLAMSEFSEGLLGKLLIRKSGKVELKLGDVVLDVTEGAAFSFLQQLVSVQLSEGKTGDMMVLGNVEHKLVLSPNFQALLAQTVAQQQMS